MFGRFLLLQTTFTPSMAAADWLAIAARVAELHGGKLYTKQDEKGFWIGLQWPMTRTQSRQ